MLGILENLIHGNDKVTCASNAVIFWRVKLATWKKTGRWEYFWIDFMEEVAYEDGRHLQTRHPSKNVGVYTKLSAFWLYLFRVFLRGTSERARKPSRDDEGFQKRKYFRQKLRKLGTN